MKNPVVTMAVVMVLTLSVSAKTTTWQGPSGGKWNVESNWNGGLPTTGDTVILNDASVNDIENLSLSAITFGGSGAYTVSGSAVTVASGITVATAAQPTIALSITAAGAQTVNVISGATLTFAGTYALGTNTLDFTAPSPTEPGTIRFETAATGSGDIAIKQGLVFVACDNALGSGAIAINTLVENKKLYGRLILAGAMIPNAISINDSNDRGGEPGLSCADGTTNVLLGKLSYVSSSCYPIIPASSELIVAGGFQMKNWFRSGAGRSTSPSGYFTVSNIAVTINGLGNTDIPEPSVRLKVSGNKIGSNLINLTTDKRRLSLEADEAFALNTSATINGEFKGTVYLNGTTQHMHGFKDLTQAEGGVFTTDDEATLYMVQKNEMGSTAYGGQINGPLNFSKSGAYKLTLGGISESPRTFASTGYLEVTEGDLELNEFCAWSSDEVRVAGSGNLILTASGNLVKKAELSVLENGKLTISDGVTVRVDKLLMAEAGGALVPQRPGDYTEGNCTFVKGGGCLRVGPPGLVLTVY